MNAVSTLSSSVAGELGRSQRQGRMVGPWIARLRYQLLGGILICSILPALVRSGGEFDRYVQSDNGLNTLVVTALAVMAGLWALRRLGRLPGAQPLHYVLPVFASAYGIAAMALLLLRLDYGRFALFSSFGLAIAWFGLVTLVAARREHMRFAALPGVDVSMAMKRHHRIEWLRINSPTQRLPGVHAVIADLRAELSDDWERFITDCTLSGTPVFHVKQVREALTGRVEIEHLSENTFGSLLPNRLYCWLKEVVDRVLALLAIILLSPLMLAVGLLVRLDSPGPVIFSQTRAGFRGESFTMYKFRTMRVSQPSADMLTAAITADLDPRITKIGRFLRRSRLDELPQLFNILRGDMSFIGPRPEAQVLSAWYTAELPFYRYRHIVKPGLTGWAQVSQGHVAAAGEVLEKLHYDFYYIKNLSLWLDMLIVARTIRTVLTGFGAR